MHSVARDLGPPLAILHRACDHICTLAAEVGIDGSRLLQCLPAPGQMAKGNSVPVIEPRYRGTCSALLYINRTSTGRLWPFLRLHTFKDGGQERTFNGLRWQCTNANSQTPMSRVALRATRDPALENARRLQRHGHFERQYCAAPHLGPDHPWLAQRLTGLADTALLSRLPVRCPQPGQLLIPFGNPHQGYTGFHQITFSPHGDRKRHFVREAGLMSGSFIRIQPKPEATARIPVLICEGLATGLTLALVWPGEVRVALSAHNLAAVRRNTPGPVIFCHDNDIWKPRVGNVGKHCAQSARQPGDRLCYPTFSRETLARARPTDFNDLLRLEGFSALHSTLERLWLDGTT
ncbi:hypothetical protein A8C75_06790 [Marinobacterium aestuarii]|uniref:Toprim domain-containing protein n=1 Tax=Marinobacterium aestuarii TaxID=1821621 RepID=A0A1A9EWJ4_9GAMM|nr:hypothetical protein [Marinobacterium aestuarii]ANG62227.1 hypothetical protein A8C75_06790 [Marinobacterium aestuarii]